MEATFGCPFKKTLISTFFFAFFPLFFPFVPFPPPDAAFILTLPLPVLPPFFAGPAPSALARLRVPGVDAPSEDRCLVLFGVVPIDCLEDGRVIGCFPARAPPPPPPPPLFLVPSVRVGAPSAVGPDRRFRSRSFALSAALSFSAPFFFLDGGGVKLDTVTNITGLAFRMR